MSVALDALTTLDASTGKAWSRKIKERTNDAIKTSTLWGRYWRGEHARIKRIQGGTKVQMRILLGYTNNFQRIGVMTTTVPQATESGTQLELPWTFGRGHYTYTDQEVMLNVGGASGDYVAQVFKDVLTQKRQVAFTGVSETLDFELIGQRPWRARMEDATLAPGVNRLPFSMHALINEFHNGTTMYADGTTTDSGLVGGLGGAALPPAIVDQGGTAWTTKQTWNPETAGLLNFRPRQEHYGTYQDDPTTITLNSYEGLWGAFFRAMLSTDLMNIAMWPEYGDAKTSPNVLLCSAKGLEMVTSASRVKQDAFYGMGQKGGQDPYYNSPNYNGVPYHYVTEMDRIALYPNTTDTTTATAVVTETSATSAHTGPRFILTRGEYLIPFAREGKFPEITKPMMPDGDSESRVVHINVWNQFGAESLRRMAHIRPNGASVLN